MSDRQLVRSWGVTVDLPDDSEDYWWVHVNKQTRDFIHGVEDERISPGDDGTGQWALSSAPTYHK